MFTLSAICTATDELLYNLDLSLKEKIDLAKCYWNAISNHIPCWNMVKSGELKPFDIRNKYICSLSLTLVALGYAGNALEVCLSGFCRSEHICVRNIIGGF